MHRRTLMAAMLLVASGAFGQDSLHVTILSPRVGPEIDADERERFSLFTQVQGFLTATVYAVGDSGFVVLMQVRGSGGVPEERRVPYPIAVLLTMAEKINHYEEIESGRYVWGSDRPTLQVADGKTFGWEEIIKKQHAPGAAMRWLPDLLPFANNTSPVESRSPVRLRFDVGLSSSSGSLQPIQDMITAIENSFRAQGYSLSHATIDDNIGALLWLGVGLDLPKGLGARLETGNALSKELTLHLMELMLVYHPPPLSTGQVRVLIGAGFTVSSLDYNQTISYGSRISPIDSRGGYILLESLQIGGSSSSSGLVAQAGIEFFPTPAQDLVLGISARYQHLEEIRVNAGQGYSTQIDLSGLLVAFTLSVVF